MKSLVQLTITIVNNQGSTDTMQRTVFENSAEYNALIKKYWEEGSSPKYANASIKYIANKRRTISVIKTKL